jgi:hypothetical protein
MAITEVDGEQIIAARLSGEPERKIAKRLGITLADVRDALDRFSATVISHHTRLHRLALDLETIDSMVETFQPMAKAGDVQAGALLAKFLESAGSCSGLSCRGAPTRSWSRRGPRRQRRAPSESPRGSSEVASRAPGGSPLQLTPHGDGARGDADGPFGPPGVVHYRRPLMRLGRGIPATFFREPVPRPRQRSRDALADIPAPFLRQLRLRQP